MRYTQDDVSNILGQLEVGNNAITTEFLAAIDGVKMTGYGDFLEVDYFYRHDETEYCKLITFEQQDDSRWLVTKIITSEA